MHPPAEKPFVNEDDVAGWVCDSYYSSQFVNWHFKSGDDKAAEFALQSVK